MTLNEIPAVLLVGGMGTRLRSVVPNAPKPMALVGDRSFLELLVLQLRQQGIRRIIMMAYQAGGCRGGLRRRGDQELNSSGLPQGLAIPDHPKDAGRAFLVREAIGAKPVVVD